MSTNHEPSEAKPGEDVRRATRIALRHNIGICAEIHRLETYDEALRIPVEHVAHYAVVLERKLYTPEVTSKQYIKVLIQHNTILEQAEEDIQLWYEFLRDNFPNMGVDEPVPNATGTDEPILPLAMILQARIDLTEAVSNINTALILQAHVDRRNKAYILQPEEEQRMIKRLDFWQIRSKGKHNLPSEYMEAVNRLKVQIDRWKSNGHWVFWCDTVGRRMKRPMISSEIMKAEIARKQRMDDERKASITASKVGLASPQRPKPFLQSLITSIHSPDSRQGSAGAQVTKAAPLSNPVQADLSHQRESATPKATPSDPTMPESRQIYNSDGLAKSTGVPDTAESGPEGFAVPSATTKASPSTVAAPFSAFGSFSRQIDAGLAPVGSLGHNPGKTSFADKTPSTMWMDTTLAAQKGPISFSFNSNTSEGPIVFGEMSKKTPGKQKTLAFGTSIVSSQEKFPDVKEGPATAVSASSEASKSEIPSLPSKESAPAMKLLSTLQLSDHGVENPADGAVSTDTLEPTSERAIVQDQAPSGPSETPQSTFPSQEVSLCIRTKEVVAGSGSSKAASPNVQIPLVPADEKKAVLDHPSITPPLSHSPPASIDVASPVAEVVAGDDTKSEAKTSPQDASIDGIDKALERMKDILKGSGVSEDRTLNEEELRTSKTAILEERISSLMEMVEQKTSSQNELSAKFEQMKAERPKEKATVARLEQRISEMSEERRKEQEVAADKQRKLNAKIEALEAHAAGTVRERELTADVLAPHQTLKERKHSDISTVLDQEDDSARAPAAQKAAEMLPAKEVVAKAPVQKAVNAIAAPKIATKTNEGSEQAKVGYPIHSSGQVSKQVSETPSSAAAMLPPLKDTTATKEKDKLLAMAMEVDELSGVVVESIRNIEQCVDPDTMPNLQTAMRYISHILKSKSIVRDMERNLKDLAARNGLYVPSWSTELAENHKIARAYIQALGAELNKLPLTDSMRIALQGHFFAEARRLRNMIDDTARKLSVHISADGTIVEEL